MEFREITLEDRDWMRQLLGYSDNRATEFNFTVLFIWRDIMNSKVCRADDFFVVRFHPQGAPAPMYIFPAGRGTEQQLKHFIQECMADAQAAGHPFRMATHLITFIQPRTLHSSGERSSRARGILYRGSRGRRDGAMKLSGRRILPNVWR